MPLANPRTDRKTMGQFITVAAVLLIGIMALPLSDEAAAADLSVRPPDSLQQEWNDMMLAGRFGLIYNGQFNRVGPKNSLIDPSTSFADDGEGWVYRAPMTVWGIRVSALKERRYLLMGQGGWVGVRRRITGQDQHWRCQDRTVWQNDSAR